VPPPPPRCPVALCKARRIVNIMIRCCCFYLVVPVASPRTDNQLPSPSPLAPQVKKASGTYMLPFAPIAPPSLLFSSPLPRGGTRKENPEQVNYKRGRMYHQNSRSGAEQQPAPKIEECYTDERTGGPVRRRGVKQASGGPFAQTLLKGHLHLLKCTDRCSSCWRSSSSLGLPAPGQTSSSPGLAISLG
jgi:hypothetical protein